MEVAKTLIRRVVEKRLDIATTAGFGISKPKHMRKIIKSGAKGVIVGSALVDIIAENKDRKEV